MQYIFARRNIDPKYDKAIAAAGKAFWATILDHTA
jgi:hypothetical protein